MVIVNGNEQNAGTETKTVRSGVTTVVVTVDNTVIDSKIDEAIKNNPGGAGNGVEIPVTDTDSPAASVALTGDIVKKLEQNAFDVSVRRDNVAYVIPAQEFNISNTAQRLGVSETELQDIKVEVNIRNLDEAVVEKYREVADANGAELIFPPVAFEVVAETVNADGTTSRLPVDRFTNYVQRVMEIPAGVDPSKVTTGIVFNADGTYSHVPTEVYQENGKWYARLNSLTNSEYSVVWNPVTVASVENHWSKDAVNDMASRLIIVDADNFVPNQAITRAGFADYIVRALGLYREGGAPEVSFADVNDTEVSALAIKIASANGIVTGYPDGTFKPAQKITREEAMVMYVRAMGITKLLGSDALRYQQYADYQSVGAWAQASVKEVLAAHVFNGISATRLSPKSNLTCAEAAQAIRNLLVESGLINR